MDFAIKSITFGLGTKCWCKYCIGYRRTFTGSFVCFILVALRVEKFVCKQKEQWNGDWDWVSLPKHAMRILLLNLLLLHLLVITFVFAWFDEHTISQRHAQMHPEHWVNSYTLYIERTPTLPNGLLIFGAHYYGKVIPKFMCNAHTFPLRVCNTRHFQTIWLLLIISRITCLKLDCVKYKCKMQNMDVWKIHSYLLFVELWSHEQMMLKLPRYRCSITKITCKPKKHPHANPLIALPWLSPCNNNNQTKLNIALQQQCQFYLDNGNLYGADKRNVAAVVANVLILPPTKELHKCWFIGSTLLKTKTSVGPFTGPSK